MNVGFFGWSAILPHRLISRDEQIPDYRFYKKGKQIVALESSEKHDAFQLMKQGYKKQFEEISAPDREHALNRFADICRDNRIDHRNFLAGAGAMPLIGVLTAVIFFLFRRKQP